MDQNIDSIKIDINRIDLYLILKIFLDNKIKTLKYLVFSSILGILLSFLQTPLYSSMVTIYPINEENGSFNEISGMASAFGLNLGVPDFQFNIIDIVKSKHLSSEIIKKKWKVKNNKDEFEANLIELWELGDSNNTTSILGIFKNKVKDILNGTFHQNPLLDNNLKLDKAIEVLNDRISIRENVSGLIEISVYMEDPFLAADISQYIYTHTLDYIMSAKQESAKLNKLFIGNRLNEIGVELELAENELTSFREKNRNTKNSPNLQLEKERLIRGVEISTQVYITLQEQYELASIEEARKNPSIVMLDKPMPIPNPVKPNRILIMLIFAFLGVVIPFLLDLNKYINREEI